MKSNPTGIFETITTLFLMVLQTFVEFVLLFLITMHNACLNRLGGYLMKIRFTNARNGNRFRKSSKTIDSVQRIYGKKPKKLKPV